MLLEGEDKEIHINPSLKQIVESNEITFKFDTDN